MDNLPLDEMGDIVAHIESARAGIADGGVDTNDAVRLLDRARRLRAFDIQSTTDNAEPRPTPHKFTCLNCDNPLDNASLYCKPFCTDFADLVRWSRKALADDPPRHDALDGVAIKLLGVYGGAGYPEKARRLSRRVRREIMERDDSTCRMCGKPATEIDHIHGNSGDPENLQAICGPCNLARRETIRVTRASDPENWTRINTIHKELVARIGAITPLKACDDEITWHIEWRSLMGKRREMARVVTVLRAYGMNEEAGILLAKYQTVGAPIGDRCD